MAQLKDSWKGEFRKKEGKKQNRSVCFGEERQRMMGQEWEGQDRIYRKDRMTSPGPYVISYWIQSNVKEMASTFYRNMMVKHINLRWLPFVRPEQTPTSLNPGKGNLASPLRSTMPVTLAQSCQGSVKDHWTFSVSLLRKTEAVELRKMHSHFSYHLFTLTCYLRIHYYTLTL